MGAVNKRGVWVPGAGDDLLQSWQTMASQLGVYMPVASTAAASAALTQAEAAGMGATVSNPILFLIGTTPDKMVYVADGSKTNGKWNLTPINETEVDESTYTGTWSNSIASGTTSVMMTSQLGAAPYDRVITATANAWGNVTGAVDFFLRVQGKDIAYSRWTPGTESTAMVTNSAVIAANTDPDIRAGIRGGGGGGTVTLSKQAAWNQLVVVAFPISMAV
mgnify:CR=1 FL=1|nr:MAG TPA: hypothetical protein [Bacteriophage sp.]